MQSAIIDNAEPANAVTLRVVAITGGPARSGHTPHAATLPDQEAQRWAPPLRCTLGFTNQSTSGQHRIRTCDLYGVNAVRIASLSAFPPGKHEQNHALAVAKRARRASGQRFKPGNREEIVGSTEVTQPTNRNPPTASPPPRPCGPSHWPATATVPRVPCRPIGHAGRLGHAPETPLGRAPCDALPSVRSRVP